MTNGGLRARTDNVERMQETMYDARTSPPVEATETIQEPSQEPIHGGLTIAEVLAAVPEARSIFQEHDFDPVTHCGPTVQIIRLDEATVHCKLNDLEGLLVKLNAAYQRKIQQSMP